jgi:hypothetical protein
MPQLQPQDQELKMVSTTSPAPSAISVSGPTISTDPTHALNSGLPGFTVLKPTVRLPQVQSPGASEDKTSDEELPQWSQFTAVTADIEDQLKAEASAAPPCEIDEAFVRRLLATKGFTLRNAYIFLKPLGGVKLYPWDKTVLL